MCESSIIEITQKITATLATFHAATYEHEQQEHQSTKTRTAKTGIPEVTILPPPPLTSMSLSKHIPKGWPYTIMDKDVENVQITAYRADEPHSTLSAKTTAAVAKAKAGAQTAATEPATAPTKRTTTCLPLLAIAAATSAAAENIFTKQSFSIKMPFRHMILTIMAVVVFSMEFAICSTSSLVQQQLMASPNNAHLPAAKTNKSDNINSTSLNLPVTSTTRITTTKTTTTATTITNTTNISSVKEISLSFPSSGPPLTATLASSLPPPLSIPVTTTMHSRQLEPPMKSAALVEKLPSTSSLTSSTLDDGSSNLQTFFMGTATLLHTEAPAHSSLQWDEVEEGSDSSELPAATSILSTYDVSNLPPLSDAEQAAKDLLTKGFSIPTYLPPFPVFAVADLPAYLNTVSTTTTEAAMPHLRPHNDMDSKENLLYSDSLSDHPLHGRLRNHHKMTPNGNSSMASENVTVQLGNHAYLPCHIHRLQNKPVSWVRLRDGHIISVDQTTFIADQRFQAIFQDDKEFTWSLQIKYVQQTDEGWYECQASSEPKMSAKVYLKVIVPFTELIGDQSRFVKAGSKVALHCIVRGTLDPPHYIIWYRDKAQIGENNRMGWYTQLDRNIFGNRGDNQNTIGSLIIPFVRKVDSGNYTCQPSNSASVSVDLHVLSGEYSASAIMSAARAYTLNDYYLLLLIFLLMLLHKT